jgi:hypothetical protein
MIHKIFTVYDAKAEAYLPPFFAATNGLAIRMFEAACNDPDHTFFKHASDYTLFCIGTFDDAKAVIENLSPHDTLGNGVEFLASTKPNLEVV